MSTATPGLSEESFRFLCQHVYTGSGIVLQPEQQYLVEARLGSLARENGLNSLDHLCAALRDTPGSHLHERVVEAMTTNETYFFREPVHYQSLREAILPELIRERQGTRKLSFWSAAASSGQEAYSTAMLLLDMGLADWHIDIVGTDLSRQVLKRAESGVYSQLEVNRGLPAAMLLKYFQRNGLKWEIDKAVRRMVRFQPFDLRSSMRTLGPFDVVFCRNVLIYFDMAVRKSIVREMHGTLFKGGTLVVGSAEAGLPEEAIFQRRTAGPAVVYTAK